MIICPKCHHVRPDDATVPDWQCPACGVVYAKARDSRLPGTDSTLTGRHAPFKPDRRFAVGRWLGLAALGVGAYVGIRRGMPWLDDDEVLGARTIERLWGRSGGTAAPASELRTLAAATDPGDVTIYTTSWCPNCKVATQWMRQQGFAFTDCDVERDAACAAQWQRLDGRGVPVLVVRGHVMKDGFDSDEFIAALQQGRGRGGRGGGGG